jgi:hypothetical protein
MVEWQNQSVVTMARSLLKSRSIPVMFWGEAIAMAVYLLNWVPTKVVNDMMLYEAWRGR